MTTQRNPADRATRTEAPLFRVYQTTLSRPEAERLAESLGIPESKFSLPYGRGSFPGPSDEGIPGGERKKRSAMPLGRFRELSPISADEAVIRSRKVLDQAELGGAAWAPVEWEETPQATVTSLELAHPQGEGFTFERLPVDTHVDFSARLDRIPLVGPGAKVKFVWGASETPDYLWFQMPRLERVGTAKLVSPAEAARSCLRKLGFDRERVEVDAELIYLLTAEERAEALVAPKYRLRAQVPVDDERGGSLELLAVYVPADQLSLELSIDLEMVGQQIRATAKPIGGAPPYSYSWHSSILLPGTVTTQQIMLNKPGNLDGGEEHLVAVVSDGTGQRVSARRLLPAGPPPSEPVDPLRKVGAEWSGNSLGEGSTGDFVGANAHDLTALFRHGGWSVVFNRGEELTQERHFIDRSVREDGIDHDYADNAQLVLFCGHGGPMGFMFPTLAEDGRLDYRDNPVWGNGELRWLALNSCSVLEPYSDEGYPNWATRWGRAFSGLHLLLGFANWTGNLPGVGASFASTALNGETLIHAWSTASIAHQEWHVEWAVMGVLDENGDIAFWQDAVPSPDLAGETPAVGQVTGYWLYKGPS